ncbi:conserved phage C-terminal domain-containing protein [Listeria monocytogenes]
MSGINNNNLLINDYPLQVLPTLAREIGLNEAIVLQQIHYWLNKKQNLHDGRYWTYRSIQKWQEENFSFWSLNTVKRTFTSLREKKLLLTANYNKKKFDKTVWYSIDYDALEAMSQRLAQNEPTISLKRANALAQNEPDNTLDLPETPKENKKNTVEELDDTSIFKNVIDFLNENAETNYRHTTQVTQTLIRARLKDGFTFEDFKKVIIIKCKDWKNDSAMSRYLRPGTLFGIKFEGYLNQKTVSGNQKKPWEKEPKKEELSPWFDKDQNGADGKVYTEDEKAQIAQKLEEAQAKYEEDRRKRGL